MARPIETVLTKSKDHRHRKNPRSRDLQIEARHALNAKRPKQHWVGGVTTSEGGHWTRETA
jgi:hypothetical protein